MDISYKRELNHSYLILKNENQQALSDYPAKMLFSNSIKGLLPCASRLIDGETSLYYEITSRQSLSQIYETKKFNSTDLKSLFEALLNTITCMEDYLLDADLLLLSPDYIYQDFESAFYFCCFPLESAPSGKDFVSLTEYLLPKINHEDNNAVLLGYGLYKDSLESPLCPALLKTALAKLKPEEPEVQDLFGSNDFQKQTFHPDEGNSDSQDVMTSFFEEETLHEKNSVGWLIGILLSLSAFSVCVYFCLHYRLISLSQTILNFLLFILLSGGSLLIFFLASKHQKKKSESIFDFASNFFSHSDSSSDSDFSSDLNFSANQDPFQDSFSASSITSDSSFSTSKADSSFDISNTQTVSAFESSVHKGLFQPSASPVSKDSFQPSASPVSKGSFQPSASSVSTTPNSYDTVLLRPEMDKTAPSASLTFLENGQPRTVFLTEEFLLIGKHPELASLCLSIPTVSRLHARIRKDNSCFFIMDLNSKNGTSINGKPLSPQEEYQLCDNDKIQISEVELTFHSYS